MNRNHWLVVFTPATWAEFASAGSSVLGFRDGSIALLRKVRIGDWLLAYVSRASCFVGIFEVTSEPFDDDSRIWSGELFPHRVRLREVVATDLEHAVDIHSLLDRFSWAPTAPSPATWQGHVQNTLRRWRPEDGLVVLDALRRAESGDR